LYSISFFRFVTVHAFDRQTDRKALHEVAEPS